MKLEQENHKSIPVHVELQYGGEFCALLHEPFFFFLNINVTTPLLYSWMKYALFASCPPWLAFPPFKVSAGTPDPVWATVTGREHGV